MVNFLLGLLLIVIGGVTMYYARWFEKWFGRVQWAENNLGGTNVMYGIIGFGLVVIGFMAIFGVVKLI